jgi:hypothetical protein
MLSALDNALGPATDDQPPVEPPEDLGDGGDDDDGGDGEPIHWVTIARYTTSEWAHLARLRLEAAGIPVFIADENVGAVAWHYALATGGIKLQVPAEQAAEAAKVLEEHPAAPVAETLAAADQEARPDPDACPQCGSTDVRASLWTARRILGLTVIVLIALSMHLLAGILVFAFAVLSVLTSRRRRCERCGTEFDDDRRRGFEVIRESQGTSSSSPPRG